MIREAKPDDFENVMALYAQLHPNDPTIADGSDRRIYDEILKATHLFLFVLDDENAQISASCYLNLIPNITRNASPYGIIENVITNEHLRNQGHGKRVVGHALQFAWNRGCYKVMLQTGSKLESTHNFYESCGFSKSEKQAFVARP